MNYIYELFFWLQYGKYNLFYVILLINFFGFNIVVHLYKTKYNIEAKNQRP